MSNKSQRHSEEYFGHWRDFWWNKDFLELMGKRWKIDQVNSVLDVGCGVGHWSFALHCILPENAQLIGVDRENDWIELATKNAAELGLEERYQFRQGVVEELPFDDNSFDMVTCQTLLIHVSNPQKAIKEMIRVLKPNGLLAVAEPNNISQTLVTNSIEKSIDDLIDVAKLQFYCERGKENLNEGNDSLGDLVPGIFSELDIKQISVYQSDKTSPLIPPYDSEEQLAIIDNEKKYAEKNIWRWEKEKTLKYYLAGGGPQDMFDHYWNEGLHGIKNRIEAINRKELSSACGMVFYLISGRK